MAVRSKPLEYAVTMDADARLAIPAGPGLETDPAWTPEHLLLAALVRCTVASLGFHAQRAGISATAVVAAHALVTRRESDRRRAVTSADVTVHATLDPLPDQGDLVEILAKAERDCFVGASLAAQPRYHWTVNDARPGPHL